jgi:hypothetical protein
MNLISFLDQVEKKLKKRGYKLDDFKKIQYGVSFSAIKRNVESKLIVYQNRDVGPWLYVGNVKNNKYRKEIKKIIKKTSKYNNLKNINLSYKIYDKDIFNDIENFLKSLGAKEKEPQYGKKRLFKIKGLTITFNKNNVAIQGKSEIGQEINQMIKDIVDKVEAGEIEEHSLNSDRKSLFSSVKDSDNLIVLHQYGEKNIYGPVILIAMYIDEEVRDLFEFLGIKYKKIFSAQRYRSILKFLRNDCDYEITIVDEDFLDCKKEINKHELIGAEYAKMITSENFDCNRLLISDNSYYKYVNKYLNERGDKFDILNLEEKEGNIKALTAARILAEDEYFRLMKDSNVI